MNVYSEIYQSFFSLFWAYFRDCSHVSLVQGEGQQLSWHHHNRCSDCNVHYQIKTIWLCLTHSDHFYCAIQSYLIYIWTTLVSLVISKFIDVILHETYILFLHTLIVQRDTTVRANEDQTPWKSNKNWMAQMLFTDFWNVDT